MPEIINYIWQSFFCLLFLFGIYWFFLRAEKAFAFNRLFILLAPLLALALPLIEIPVQFSKPSISLEETEFLRSLAAVPEAEEIVGTFGLPEVTVQGSKLPLLMELRDYLLVGYLLVVVFLGCKVYWQYIQLQMLLRKGWYQTTFDLKGDYFLVPTYGLATVFSFFDKLFWDDTQQLRADERAQVIQHEIVHIRKKHSWDLVYYEILCVLLWFNPVIYLMRSALVDTHEYQADAGVLKATPGKASYPKLLVKVAFKDLDLSLGNYFAKSTTLKRIEMMKNQSRINWLKVSLVLPLTVILLALVSMKTIRVPYSSDKKKAEVRQQDEDLSLPAPAEWRQTSVQETLSGFMTPPLMSGAESINGHILDLSIEDNDHVLLRGKKVLRENLRFRIAVETRQLQGRKVDPAQVTALIKIQADTNPEWIGEIKNMFVARGITNIKVDSISHAQISPVLVF